MLIIEMINMLVEMITRFFGEKKDVSIRWIQFEFTVSTKIPNVF